MEKSKAPFWLTFHPRFIFFVLFIFIFITTGPIKLSILRKLNMCLRMVLGYIVFRFQFFVGLSCFSVLRHTVPSDVIKIRIIHLLFRGFLSHFSSHFYDVTWLIFETLCPAITVMTDKGHIWSTKFSYICLSMISWFVINSVQT